MGMVIGLLTQGLMTITAAIAVMLGAEVGTCTDMLIASVGRSRAATETDLFHLLFNLSTIFLGTMLLPFFTKLVMAVSQGASATQTVANAHMLFNRLGMLVVLPFWGLYENC